MRGVGGRAAIAALAGLLAGVSPAAATSVVELQLDEAVRAAHTIVRAQVVAVEEAWGSFQDEPAILTTYRLANEQVLLGAAPRQVVVFGGTVGDRTMTLEGQPQLSAGSEVLLLLCQGTADSPFVGIWQGAYQVRGGRVYRGERAVIDVVDGRVLLARDGEPAMRVDAFQGELLAAIERRTAERPAPAPLAPVGFDRPLLRPLDPFLTEALGRREGLTAPGATGTPALTNARPANGTPASGSPANGTQPNGRDARAAGGLR